MNHDAFGISRLTPESAKRMIDLVNRTVAQESTLKERIAIVRQGERLTERLSIGQDEGWFRPMLNDLLRQGISIVINDIPITDALADDVSRQTGLPAEWITQQNLYITPGDSQGFDPHCDPHVVAVAHLFGRKTWTIFEKTLDNPVYDAETSTIAGKNETLPVRTTVTVEPGDCFVIPRGVYHSAVALTPASVHLAIGVAGARAIDYIWAMAEAAMHESRLRADRTPEAALRDAQDFVRGFAADPVALPRFARVAAPADLNGDRFSFEDVLDALPGH
jgi:hypothetical protein